MIQINLELHIAIVGMSQLPFPILPVPVHSTSQWVMPTLLDKSNAYKTFKECQYSSVVYTDQTTLCVKMIAVYLILRKEFNFFEVLLRPRRLRPHLMLDIIDIIATTS